MSSPDLALLDAARNGDRMALEQLFSRHQARVYRFGKKMCGDDADAQDVLQETFIAAARSLPDFRGASSVSTWLYTIARSFCIKHRRTSKFAPTHLESLEQDPAGAAQLAHPGRSPEEDAAGRQLQGVLDQAIASLEPMYREVLILRDVEGLSAPEVAEALDLTVEAVKSRLHRARVAVRELVAPSIGRSDQAGAPSPGCRDVVEAFSRRMEGEIDGSACAELEQHLEQCPTCRGRCDTLKTTLSMCKRAGEAPVPPSVETTVRQALRRFLDARP
jgi:RNA polymerase sigma-70 factor (ECF subfamily)